MAVTAYFLDLSSANITDPENQVTGVENQIPVDSYGWGVHNAGGGQAGWSDMHFSAATSSASPNLMAYCSEQTAIDTAILTIQTTAGGQQTWVKITLSKVLVSSYQMGGSGGDNLAPVDQFSLSYGQIEYAYNPQPDGTAVTVKYDTTSNKPC